MVNRWWWLLAFLLVETQHCLASQHRTYQDAAEDVNNGPEDLFLEELVRNLKWKAAQQKQQQQPATYFRQRQQQPQLTDIRLLEEEDDDYAEQDDKVLFQPRIEQPFQQHQEQKNFAYRPHDDRFHNNQQHRPVPVEPVRQIKTINPLIQPAAVPNIPLQMSSNDIRTAGQKETDIFDEGPVTMTQQQQPIPISSGMGKFMEPVTSQEEADESLESRNSRDPIAHAIVSPAKTERIHDSLADIYLTALVAGCTASVVAALLALGVCFYRWQRRAKAAQEVEYPAYGITGPGPSPSGKSSLKSSPSSTTPGGGIGSWTLGKTPKSMASSGDKKLAHSAHMFHFQHQKQQVIALESSHSGCDRRGSNSGGESDEDNEEGDYTVYECPGLAPTGEMEVKNPLFLDDPTPATPAAVKRQSK